MNDDTVKTIATAIIVLSELYAIYGHSLAPLAWLFDALARITGSIANILARISVQSRIAYFKVVQE